MIDNKSYDTLPRGFIKCAHADHDKAISESVEGVRAVCDRSFRYKKLYRRSYLY